MGIPVHSVKRQVSARLDKPATNDGLEGAQAGKIGGAVPMLGSREYRQAMGLTRTPETRVCKFMGSTGFDLCSG